MTSIHPKNAHELLLYRILHRANLLDYFENFLTQGGDDIQQLCEAGEDEFLEIMTLVGMSSKPLHVRRLQKALQEFYSNPDLYEQSETEFKSPNINENTSQSFTSHSTPNPLHHISTTISKIINRENLINMNPLQNICPPTQIYSNNKILNYDGLPTMVGYNNNNSLENFEHISQLEMSGSENKEYPNLDYMGINNPTAFTNNKINPDFFMNHSTLKSTLMDLGIDILSQPTTPPTRVHISGTERVKIRENAKALSESLPPFTAKPLNMKKPTNKEITDLINCTNRDSKWEAKVRQYGAIYGRFDSKRKEKPMTLHELCVNEAAMQLCLYIPELLTRRDELFPLARQVVRNSGYQYAKGTKKSKSSHSKRPSAKNGELSTSDLNNSGHASAVKIKAEYETESHNIAHTNPSMKDLAAFKQGNYYGATAGLHNPAAAAMFDASAAAAIRYDYNYYAGKMGAALPLPPPAPTPAAPSKRTPFPSPFPPPGHHPLAAPPSTPHDDRMALAEFHSWAAAAAAANNSPRPPESTPGTPHSVTAPAAGHRRFSSAAAGEQGQQSASGLEDHHGGHAHHPHTHHPHGHSQQHAHNQQLHHHHQRLLQQHQQQQQHSFAPAAAAPPSRTTPPGGGVAKRPKPSPPVASPASGSQGLPAPPPPTPAASGGGSSSGGSNGGGGGGESTTTTTPSFSKKMANFDQISTAVSIINDLIKNNSSHPEG